MCQDAVARLGLAVTALDNFDVVFVENDLHSVIMRITGMHKTTLQIIVFYTHFAAVNGRSKGARIDLDLNILKVQ